MIKSVFYIPFKTLLGDIRTETSEGLKRRMQVLSDVEMFSGMLTIISQWSEGS